jgi:hypothetical protein
MCGVKIPDAVPDLRGFDPLIHLPFRFKVGQKALHDGKEVIVTDSRQIFLQGMGKCENRYSFRDGIGFHEAPESQLTEIPDFRFKVGQKVLYEGKPVAIWHGRSSCWCSLDQCKCENRYTIHDDKGWYDVAECQLAEMPDESRLRLCNDADFIDLRAPRFKVGQKALYGGLPVVIVGFIDNMPPVLWYEVRDDRPHGRCFKVSENSLTEISEPHKPISWWRSCLTWLFKD